MSAYRKRYPHADAWGLASAKYSRFAEFLTLNQRTALDYPVCFRYKAFEMSRTKSRTRRNGIAGRLLETRTRLHWTQDAVAKELGVPLRTYQSWETDIRKLSAPSKKLIEGFLSVHKRLTDPDLERIGLTREEVQNKLSKAGVAMVKAPRKRTVYA